MSNGKKIVYATPDELIYEPTKTVLERTWDKLASHYSSIIEPNTFQKMNTKLLQAKVELETNNTVYDLLQKDVIKPEKINNTLQNIDYNLVKKGIQDCKKIVSTKIDLLDKAIKKETEMSKLMKDNDYCVIDGLVNVFIDSNYIVYDDKIIYPVKWKPIGLCCTIKYNGIVFMASVEPELFNDDIEQVTEYTKEINSECNEKWKRLEILVERKEVNESDGDEIAKFVIRKRKQGMKMVDLQEMVICYLSRVFVKDFGGNDNFVNGVGKKMIDGLTKEFFCFVDDQVIRVVRKEGKIEMYLDEQLVDIEQKQE